MVESVSSQDVDDKKMQNNLPNTSSSSVKIKYVKLGYHYLVSNAIYLLLTPLLAITYADHLSTLKAEDELSLTCKIWVLLRSNFILVFLCSAFIVFTTTMYFMGRPRKVYLVDFACHKPDPDNRCSGELFLKVSADTKRFTEESLEFQKRILEKSGYGSMTHIPKGLLWEPKEHSMAGARKETETVIFGAIDEVLGKTGVSPREIGILVVNSSLFNPTPSLSAAVVNHFKLRSNILSYNLGGMGCSAGMISIDLANHLLQVFPNTYALVVSTENITYHWYQGNNRSMLLSNCLFRVGGSAVLLSNRSSDRRRSKYRLLHTVRTHKGADDTSYKSVYQQEDEDGVVGVSLSKQLMSVAGETLKANITTLGPLVLPLSEQLLFLASLAAKKLLGKKTMKPYVPDFRLAFEHFCVHAGGRGVLDEIEKSLKLTEWDMEPSRMTLYRFGNTSSSSVWYELAYSEAKGRVKKGDRIWQIGFGSGFKCSSSVWRAIRNIKPTQEKNPWMDEIDTFPVRVPKFAPIDF